MLDTETANTITTDNGKLDMSNVLFYDLGGQVIDKKGKVYHRFSFVNSDIFYGMKELMKSAYYANKIPRYIEDIQKGARLVRNTYQIKDYIYRLCRAFNIKIVCAHNARFDNNALNITQRYITKSKYRYFLPYGITWYDTLKMAKDTICKQKGYITFCRENGYITKNGQVKATAEVIYKYISGNNNFIESHTGLEDVEIETRILAHCFRQHKKMRKKLFNSP